jgi:hypothetical protein
MIGFSITAVIIINVVPKQSVCFRQIKTPAILLTGAFDLQNVSGFI